MDLKFNLIKRISNENLKIKLYDVIIDVKKIGNTTFLKIKILPPPQN